MGAGASEIEDKGVFVYTVNEKPVWLNVTLAVIGVVAAEGMIFAFGRERTLANEDLDDGF